MQRRLAPRLKWRNLLYKWQGKDAGVGRDEEAEEAQLKKQKMDKKNYKITIQISTMVARNKLLARKKANDLVTK